MLGVILKALQSVEKTLQSDGLFLAPGEQGFDPSTELVDVGRVGACFLAVLSAHRRGPVERARGAHAQERAVFILELVCLLV